MEAKADEERGRRMKEEASEGWIDRHGRLLAAEALKTYRNPEDAMVAVQRPGEIRWLWADTGQPRMPSHLEDGAMTPFLMSDIMRRLEAERQVQVPSRLEASSSRTCEAKARLEEIAALTLSWWCMDAGERAERASAVMKEVQALAAVGSGP
ncbi:hypothetical protein [Geothrix sp. PMB-07]|uniref:hypothetical protein n=1 Tax=Geothrix sp. PMB-07 TaxID=3068640 RepID=UPI002740D013|nr:hypothetical protein [Geothrix sp. PMB-07]WLT33348.1 hypothetical protein Q9293_08415 [Geothrix sp. PMB-07]